MIGAWGQGVLGGTGGAMLALRALKAAAILGIAGLCGLPVAQAADGNGFYVGVGVGSADAKRTSSWAQNADANQLLLGFTSNTVISSNDTGWKVFGGYRFNENFAVEGGYTDFGTFSGLSVISAPAPGFATGRWRAYSPINASVVGLWPIWQQLSVFGKLGLAYTHVDGEVDGPTPFKLSSSRAQPLLGLGLNYDFAKFGVRAEFERFNNVGDGTITGQSNIYLWSLGAQYHF